jgi:hypothetical protein
MNLKIGIVVLATGPYIQFVPDLIESVRKYFLVGTAGISPFILTDAATCLEGVRCPIEHAKWPGVNMHRYHSVLRYEKQYKGMDFLFNFDADLIVKQPIGKEILANLVGLISPTAWRWPVDKFLYERRPESASYIPFGQGKHFFNASISGGLIGPYLDAIGRIAALIDRDEQAGLSCPQCHEEAALNYEFLHYPPALSLTPDWCWPVGTYSLKRDFIKPIVSMRLKNKTLDTFK